LPRNRVSDSGRGQPRLITRWFCRISAERYITGPYVVRHRWSTTSVDRHCSYEPSQRRVVSATYREASVVPFVRGGGGHSPGRAFTDDCQNDEFRRIHKARQRGWLARIYKTRKQSFPVIDNGRRVELSRRPYAYINGWSTSFEKNQLRRIRKGGNKTVSFTRRFLYILDSIFASVTAARVIQS